MNLTEISIKRPSIIIVIFTILMLGGAWCYTTLRYELLPPMEVPTLVITTPYPGAAPIEVEQSVTKKIEDVVSGMDGIKGVLSQSYEGVSVLIVEFRVGTDIDQKQQDAQRFINNILNTLPEDVESPSIVKVSPSDQPILELMIVSTLGARETYDLTENEILPQIQQIEGIGETRLIGGQKREIQVNVDKDKLSYYGISLKTSDERRELANLDFPTGKVKDRDDQITVRLAGKFSSTKQIEELIVASPSGSPVRVRDVATVIDATKDQSSISRFNGQEGIGISIKKQCDANAVAISEELREKIATMERKYGRQGSVGDHCR